MTIKELHAFTFGMQIYVDESHSWAKFGQNRTVTPQFLYQESLRQAVAASPKPPLWIFDIDSTLFCLSHRFQQIFFDYLRFHSETPVPSLYWRIAQGLSPEWHRYGIEATLAPAFLHWGVPNAEFVAKQLAEKMHPFWYDVFFSERYLDRDFAYPFAVEFVNQLHAAGIHIAYLTGRHAKTMTHGTRKSLREMGFPLDDQTSFLIMKAEIDESDVGYKHRYLEYLNQRYKVLGFMDNEPENVHAQITICRDSLPVWFHSISSDRIPDLHQSDEKHLCVMRSFAN